MPQYPTSSASQLRAVVCQPGLYPNIQWHFSAGPPSSLKPFSGIAPVRFDHSNLSMSKTQACWFCVRIWNHPHSSSAGPALQTSQKVATLSLQQTVIYPCNIVSRISHHSLRLPKAEPTGYLRAPCLFLIGSTLKTPIYESIARRKVVVDKRNDNVRREKISANRESFI